MGKKEDAINAESKSERHARLNARKEKDIPEKHDKHAAKEAPEENENADG
jgi:hypothetical protein